MDLLRPPHPPVDNPGDLQWRGRNFDMTCSKQTKRDFHVATSVPTSGTPGGTPHGDIAFVGIIKQQQGCAAANATCEGAGE
jgi:hypothetical protein